MASGINRLAVKVREKFYSGEARLPVLPEAVVRVRAIVGDDTKGAHDIAEAIRQDSTLSTTVLRLANSARFNPGGREVRSLPAAIQRLGGRRTLQLLIAISSKLLIRVSHPLLLEIHRESSAHALRIAVTAQTLARVIRDSDPEEVFLAGLIHDVGVLAVVCAVPDELLACAADELRRCVDMLHREMGGRLLLHWEMPLCFSQVAVHHGIESEDRPRERLIDFVDAAEFLLGLFARNGPISASGMDNMPAVRRLGVTETHLAAVRVGLEEGIGELQGVLGGG